MSGPSTRVWQLWRATTRRTSADRAFAAYAAVMVGVVVVAPLGRAAWIGFSDPVVLSALSSGTAAPAYALTAAAIWLAALLAGSTRGPVILPPFLAYAVGTSASMRRHGFARPFLHAAALLTGAAAFSTAVIGALLFAHDLASVTDAVCLTLGGALVGLIAAVLWLVGEALPARISARVFVVGATSVVVTSLAPESALFTPWGWFGMLSPAGATTLWALSLLCVAGLLAAASIPLVLDRLRTARVLAQSLRWDSARAAAYGMDLSQVAGLYRVHPRAGRRLHAVTGIRSVEARILLRDAVGAARTPGRLIAGCLGLLTGGALLAAAVAFPGVLVAAGIGAGLLVYAGLGALTDGIRHAAEAAAGPLHLYGMGDGRLVASHLLFPIIMGTVLVVAAIIVIGMAMPVTPAAALSGLVTAILGVAARLCDALKPPMPTGLLAPIPTPMGDLGVAVRAAWAVEAAITAAVIGVAAAMSTVSVVPLVVVGVGLVWRSAHRWTRR